MRDWTDNIRKVTPYVPGEHPDNPKAIKLNTNENPYPPAPAVMEALKGIGDLARYPDSSAKALIDAIADFKGLPSDQVIVGVGSDDVLALAFMTFFNSDKPILFPDVSYTFYDVWANVMGVKFEKPRVDDDFRIIPSDYYKENGGVIFPNPNAPTGLVLPLEDVRDILDHNRDVVVIVDEAYVDFGGESAQCLIDEYENLLVVQTFSKSRALAGLRIGYAMGSKKIIQALNDVKYSVNSYSMNTPSILCGTASMKDVDYFHETLEKIKKTREWTKVELRKLGFTFPDSMCNFIFATHKNVPAKELFEAAKANDIFVRYFPGERTGNHLRITIGTDEEMEALVAFFRNYLNQKN